MAGEVAPYLDGIPVVADAATRDAKFPLATRSQNQRVFRLDTLRQDRWSGSVWVKDTAAPVFDVTMTPFNAAGDGVTDDSAAIQSAILTAFAAGGGTVYLPKGTYLLSTVQGAYKILLRPRSGVSIRGQGPTSILKAANGLNTAAANDGFSFLRHIVNDEAIARLDDVVVADLQFDHNGLNNLLPNGFSSKPNIAVGAEVGKNLRIERCTFTNNAGQQTLSFGNNTSPAKIEQLFITNNVFREMGASVVGNVFSSDHSTIYAQAIGAEIIGNVFTNATATSLSTAIECHLSDSVVIGNTCANYGRMFNVVATVADQLRTAYHGNQGRGLTTGAMFWQSGSFVMRDVRFSNNVLEQIAGSSVVTQDFIDSSTTNTNGIDSLEITDNTFLSLQAAANASGAGGISFGKHKRLTIHGNMIRGFKGRGINLPTVPDPAMRLTITENDIIDCGTSSDASFKQGIAIITATSTAFTLIARNRIHNVAGTYMTTGIFLNFTVGTTLCHVQGNLVTGVAADLTNVTATNVVIDHTGPGTPVALAIVAAPGSRWCNTNGGASTTTYVKETLQTSSGWVAK